MSSPRSGHDATALLRAAFDVGSEAVLVFDRQRNVVHANESARRPAGVGVLFVDDNAEARALVKAVLEASGADAATGASAAEALGALEKENVDVVLTDIGMPVLDGYDFVMRLRELERAANRVPVCAIALTAHAGAEERRRALTGGFQEYLAKPIDPDELVRAVDAVLRRRQSRLRASTSRSGAGAADSCGSRAESRSSERRANTHRRSRTRYRRSARA